MGKFKDGINNAALRTGNTIATPLRRWGEIGNAVANVLVQWKSSAKNTAEVWKQTIDTLMDNFLNFSKVEGKWYQRFLKWTINLASAVTRRPMMIGWAALASTANQWIRQPFKKLLYTPGKMFKGMRNATRIFSKKKGFDFTDYDTHETGKDTRINQIKEKRFGFFGKGWSKSAEKEKPVEVKKAESQKLVEPKKEAPKSESTAVIPAPTPAPAPLEKPSTPKEEPPKSINEIEKKYKEESEKKDKDAQAKEFPKRNTMDESFKKQYIKDYEKTLGWKASEEGILERWKKNKKWDNIDQIMIVVKKENPTMAEYFDSLLAKKTPAAKVA